MNALAPTQEVLAPMQRDPNEIPYGYCQCGCGERTPILTKNDRYHGHVKGEPAKCISGHNVNHTGRAKCATCTRFVARGVHECEVCAARNAKTTKLCGICKVDKPFRQFSRDATRFDGLCPRCRLCNREESRESSKKHPQTKLANTAKWVRENPEKANAHTAVQRAVKAGRLVRPDTCSRCGAEGQIHGHHRDYSKPLEVEWLCGPCHREEHGQEYRDAA